MTERRSNAGPIVLLVLGSIVGLVALGTLVGGGALLWADKTQRDADGYFATGAHSYASNAYAITHEGAKVDRGPGWLDLGKLARVRIHAGSGNGRALFIGIGPRRDVAAYLANVAHSKLTDFGLRPFKVSYEQFGGTVKPSPPGSKHFWIASATGESPTLTWKVRSGNWSIVLMNANGSRGVATKASVGANIGYLAWIWTGLFIGGALLLAIAILLIILGARGLGRGGAVVPADAPVAGPVAAAGAGTYPAVLAARLDEPLSRWLWLVKWLLAIPHLIVLAFLWIAFFVLTVVAWFAILFTGRYPRGIFDFNLGVLRWTWRVTAYGYGALSTDRYPPFSLDREPDYPATLDVAYPERLSRGLIFVKWLLALPQLLIVGVLVGGGAYWVEHSSHWHVTSPWSGLIGLLALIAGFALLFTARYPRGLFDLVVGLNRWALRVLAYVALMTDVYPPFRLDQGGDEPAPTPAASVPDPA